MEEGERRDGRPTQLLRLLDLDQIPFLSNLPSFLVLGEGGDLWNCEKEEKSR